MVSYILCDTGKRHRLYPFTLTRPVADCRTGILTIREKWEYHLGTHTSTLTEDYLSEKFPLHITGDNFFINGSLIPNKELVKKITGLQQKENLFWGNTWIASRCGTMDEYRSSAAFKKITYGKSCNFIEFPWDLVSQNNSLLREDFLILTQGRKSQPQDDSNKILNPENIFIEDGARLFGVTINASDGPVFIGKNTQVMEGSMIRGPFALCDGSVLKMGTKIYGATTIGPHSIAGGEIKNSIIFGFSNKAHDGYLGDAVIGEWCNLGAGTNCSNLKNNVSNVQVWNEKEQKFFDAGKKCGMMMGDFSRTGIQSMINTGTVVGTSCNIFGSGFPPKYVPSFSWGQVEESEKYQIEKAIRDTNEWMKLKGKKMDGNTENILRKLFERSMGNIG